MARRSAMRGRPGVLLIFVIVACLLIVYLSWRSMMAPASTPGMININELQGHARFDSLKDRHDSLYQVIKKGNINKQPEVLMAPQIGRNKPSNSEETDPSRDNLKIDDYDDMVSELTKPGKKPIQSITPVPLENRQKKVPWYMDTDEAITKTVGSMERFVHLDLKGAAPKVSYLEKLFPLLFKLGATGLLLEYEDTFPYSGQLEGLAADDAYTMGDIQHIVALAKTSRLKVMPLIQTFGHMEFALKSAEKLLLRESEFTPQVIASSSEASYELISAMISQVLKAHPEVTHMHIGCDEVYELGRGKSKDVMITNKVTKNTMFVNHVTRVAELVKNHKNNGQPIVPVMWDDELRNMPIQDLDKSRLPSLVEIMVWNYLPNVTEVLNDAVWIKYAQLFNSVWIASSFKGATGPKQFYTEATYHLSNHFSWLKIIAKYKENIKFRGVALTGWQRFDHFATLCELFPVAVPSLAVCLATLKNGGFNELIHKSTSHLLGCSSLVEVKFPVINKKTKKSVVTQDCRFPGHEVYYAMQEYYGYTTFHKEIQDVASGWLTNYHMKHGFTNPGVLKNLRKNIGKDNSNFMHSETVLSQELRNIFSNDTVQEWVEENIYEMYIQNTEMEAKVQAMLKNTVWGKRPLPRLERSTFQPTIRQEDQIGKGNKGNPPVSYRNVDKLTVTAKESFQSRGSDKLTAKKSYQPRRLDDLTVKESNQYRGSEKLKSNLYQFKSSTDLATNPFLPNYSRGNPVYTMRNTKVKENVIRVPNFNSHRDVNIPDKVDEQVANLKIDDRKIRILKEKLLLGPHKNTEGKDDFVNKSTLKKLEMTTLDRNILGAEKFRREKYKIGERSEKVSVVGKEQFGSIHKDAENVINKTDMGWKGHVLEGEKG